MTEYNNFVETLLLDAAYIEGDFVVDAADGTGGERLLIIAPIKQ